MVSDAKWLVVPKVEYGASAYFGLYFGLVVFYSTLFNMDSLKIAILLLPRYLVRIAKWRGRGPIAVPRSKTCGEMGHICRGKRSYHVFLRSFD